MASHTGSIYVNFYLFRGYVRQSRQLKKQKLFNFLPLGVTALQSPCSHAILLLQTSAERDPKKSAKTPSRVKVEQ